MSPNLKFDAKNKEREGSNNRGQISKTVLMVFPSQLSITRLDDLAADVRLAFRAKKVESKNIFSEDGLIVFEMNDVVEGAAIASKRFGIEKVAIAREIPNSNFGRISSEIVNVGKLKLLPQEKFFVKVQISKNAMVNYKPRDLEFASTGDLISALKSSSYHSKSDKVSRTSDALCPRPARNEMDADRCIEVYVGKRSAYVCIESDKGLGGLSFGSQKQRALCAIYDTLSCISCISMLKCGFLPEIVVLYSDDENLRQILKMLGFVVSKLNTGKYSIRLARLQPRGVNQAIEQPHKMVYHEWMLKCMVSIGVLSRMNEKNVVLPFSAAIHPPWLIESIIKKIIALNKVPWMPLLLPVFDIHTIAMELGIDEFMPRMLWNNILNQAAFGSTFSSRVYNRYSKIIDKLAENAMNDMKLISFEIGLNYLHNILDSI